MAVTQYIGARYMPIFADPPEHSTAKSYEPLTIVLHEGNSYTSKQFVPVGIEITNEAYWAETGNYNAQVEAYRQEVRQYANTMDDVLQKINVKAYLFDTVADLLASTVIEAGDVCFTSGYHAIGDNGANCYLITSDIANGFDKLAIRNNLTATLVLLDDCLYPEQLGAYGDGVNNDTAAINHALQLAKTLNLSPKDYKADTSIVVPYDRKVIGINGSHIVYEGAEFALVCGSQTESVRWRDCPVVINGIEISAPNGSSVAFYNMTQGVLKNCSLRCSQDANRDNVLIARQSHYFTVENNYIYGGNGIVVDVSCNGCTIKNNYVTYCYNGMTINGDYHYIVQNDAEGYTRFPYVLNTNNSVIYCYGERNLFVANAAWIALAGNFNELRIRMNSDGTRYYTQLISINGNQNKIDMVGCSGYTLFSSIEGSGNTFNIKGCQRLLNGQLFELANLTDGNELDLMPGKLLIDSDTEDISTYFTGSYTWNSETKRVTEQTGDRFTIDFSSLSSDAPLYLYYKFTGVSASAHGELVTKSSESATATQKISGKLMCFPSAGNFFKVYEESQAQGKAFTIDKFKVSNTICKELFK